MTENYNNWFIYYKNEKYVPFKINEFYTRKCKINMIFLVTFRWINSSYLDRFCSGNSNDCRSYSIDDFG